MSARLFLFFCAAERSFLNPSPSHYARYFLFSNDLVLFPAFLCPVLPKSTIPETILISYMPAYLANHFQPLVSKPKGKYPGLLLQIRIP